MRLIISRICLPGRVAGILSPFRKSGAVRRLAGKSSPWTLLWQERLPGVPLASPSQAHSLEPRVGSRISPLSKGHLMGFAALPLLVPMKDLLTLTMGDVKVALDQRNLGTKVRGNGAGQTTGATSPRASPKLLLCSQGPHFNPPHLCPRLRQSLAVAQSWGSQPLSCGR